ncbi:MULTISPECIES: PilZ domain-containing protein [Sphingobium]|uniref:Pilus assembly protein PilZ n=1 Tax=Sphingobium chungbukense TaxID=56193 RepID=A0A0M3AR24_9SPHN|nr:MULTISPECIES: PilZ domain-containing protein [Sphingobium]KKW92353.1 pilus assembly protein PilZ [Sphingobium chungbukense]PJG48787.1 PilZ domain-containing protein [Sphingobium sp. LB126]
MVESTAAAGQRRHDPRHKMFEPVALHFGGMAARAHFLDLSCSGALAHCETPPAAGTFLTVEGQGQEASGRVIWANGKRFGIQFSQPLTQSAMTAWIEGY